MSFATRSIPRPVEALVREQQALGVEVIGPQRGPQEVFLASPATVCVYGGSAGGGKSFALLLDALRYAALSPRRGYRAAIFRRVMPQITLPGGLWDESASIYSLAGGKDNQTLHEWRWPAWDTKIKFASMQYEADRFKWQGAQLAYCCEEATPVVMGDGTTRAVGDIQVGDEVMTLEGPRRVTRKAARRLEQCVEATIYNADGDVIGRQIHSETHRMLTPQGWLSYGDIVCGSRPSLSSSSTQPQDGHRSAAQCDKRSDIARQCRGIPVEGQRPPRGSNPKSQGHRCASDSCACREQAVQGSGYGSSEDQHGAISPLPSICVPVTLCVPTPRLLERDSGQRVLGRELPYVRFGSQPEGCQDHYLADRRLCDEQIHRFSEGDQVYQQQQGDAAEHSPSYCNLDVLGETPKYSLETQRYTHPYKRDIRRACVGLQRGTCTLTPCGHRWVIDLTVSDVSHYCTTSGLINQNCGFDELTHFTEEQYFYLFSRKRSKSGAPTRIRATTNPDADSWVKRFLAPWVDETYDGPGGPARSGEIRWFLRDGGVIHWLAPGERHIDGVSVTFIAASIFDNPALLSADPSYLSSLKALPLVERQRLLYGDWSARNTGALFKRHWFPLIDAAPAAADIARVVRYWDLAATEPSESNVDPDWTAGVKVARLKDDSYVVLDMRRERISSAKVEELVRRTADADGHEVAIFMEQEPGSSGKSIIDYYRRKVLAGFAFSGIKSTGDKETRARPVASQAEGRNIAMVRSHWNDALLSELEAFPTQGVHDDTVDSLSGAMQQLFTKSAESHVEWTKKYLEMRQGKQ